MARMSKLARFSSAIRKLSPEQISLRDYSVMDMLEVESDGVMRTWYAPLEMVHTEAPLVLVGLTPGPVQASAALATANKLLGAGAPEEEILAQVKRDASFKGPLRDGLVQMLDLVGVHSWLGITSCSMLFGGQAEHLLHSTSILKYPTYYRLEPYSGIPVVHRIPLLKRQAEEGFLRDVAGMPNARFIAVGKQPALTLEAFCRSGQLDRGKVLGQLPVPVGSNYERTAYFLGHKTKAELSSRTSSEKVDEQKVALMLNVAEQPRLPTLRAIVSV